MEAAGRRRERAEGGGCASGGRMGSANGCERVSEEERKEKRGDEYVPAQTHSIADCAWPAGNGLSAGSDTPGQKRERERGLAGGSRGESAQLLACWACTDRAVGVSELIADAERGRAGRPRQLSVPMAGPEADRGLGTATRSMSLGDSCVCGSSGKLRGTMEAVR